MSNTIPEDHEAPPPPELKPNIHIPDTNDGMSKDKKVERSGPYSGESVRASLITKEIGHFKGNDEDIDDDKLRLFIRNVIKEKRRAQDTRKWLYASLVAILFLCAANIGTAYLAVSLAKDTEVSGDQFVSTKTGDMVGTMGYRQMLNLQMMNSSVPSNMRSLRMLEEEDMEDGNNVTDEEIPYFACVRTEQWARIWNRAENGAAVGLTLSFGTRNFDSWLTRRLIDRVDPVLNSSDQEGDREFGVELRWSGSELNSEEACFASTDEDTEYCMSFDDEDPDNVRCNELDQDSDQNEEIDGREWERRFLNAKEDKVGASSGSSYTKDVFMKHLNTYRAGGSSSKNGVHEVKDALNLKSRILNEEGEDEGKGKPILRSIAVRPKQKGGLFSLSDIPSSESSVKYVEFVCDDLYESCVLNICMDLAEKCKVEKCSFSSDDCISKICKTLIGPCGMIVRGTLIHVSTTNYGDH